MVAKHLLKNNLQQLYITHNGFNFFVNYYTKKNQTICVRKSLRLLNQPSPKYCLTQQYIKKQFDILTKSSVNIQLESSTLVLSNSTCITDNGFVEKDLQEFGSNSQEFCSQELKSNLQNFKKQKIKAIAQHGFTIDALSLTTEIQYQIDININLMKTKKEIIDKYEQQIREFSLCLLIFNNKKVYLSKRCNPIKDYFDYLQSTGGFKEKNKTFEDCARHKALKKAKLELKELFLMSLQTAIYFTILDDNMFSKQVESNNNGKWYPYELKELSKLKLTSSIEPNFKQIMEII
ncbi:hypothetical protein C2G38_2173896 [Gigaspora rosea]|uniref:Uncharacterized protein n=1 Tax=Gigaspora rosea TaxID=44941 RepID=A0A397VN83_9GLOM|nr:hypothetical protein C2G38_2173896 [Gigaspora rosea]